PEPHGGRMIPPRLASPTCSQDACAHAEARHVNRGSVVGADIPQPTRRNSQGFTMASFRRTSAVTFYLALVLVLFGHTPVRAQANPIVYGKTFGEWEAGWWSWAA